MKPKDYAIYKGDEFLYMGTAKECAEHFGIKVNTIHFIATTIYKKRMQERNNANWKYAVAIEDKEE